jgi:hypothetical protein
MAADRRDAVWMMHTQADVTTAGSLATLTQNGERLHVRLLEPADSSWTVEEVTLDAPQRPLPNTRKLLLRFQTAPRLTRVAVLISPQTAIADTRRLRALDEWGAAYGRK